MRLKAVKKDVARVLTVLREKELAGFYQERMASMQAFFKTLDSLVSAALKFESLVSLSLLRKMIEKAAAE